MGKEKGGEPLFAMNLNHSSTDAFCYLKNKTFGNRWGIQVDK